MKILAPALNQQRNCLYFINNIIINLFKYENGRFFLYYKILATLNSLGIITR